MAEYLPPLELVPIFNSLNYVNPSGTLTVEQADLLYLQFPQAQGTETLKTTNVSGLLTTTGGIDASATQSINFGTNVATGTISQSNTSLVNLVDNSVNYSIPLVNNAGATGYFSLNADSNSNFTYNPNINLLTIGGGVNGAVSVTGTNSYVSIAGVTGPGGYSLNVPNGSAYINSLSVGGLTGPVGINGAVTINGSLGVTGPVTFAGSLGVTGPSTFTGTTTFNNDITVNAIKIGQGPTLTGSLRIGTNSLVGSTGSQNTAIVGLISNTSGSNNTCLGGALNANNTGSSNTGIGNVALNTNTTGFANTAVGLGALYASNLANNTACGYAAGNIGGVFNTGALNTSQCTFLGAQSGVADNSSTYTKSTAIGFGATLPAGSTNKIVLGTSTDTVLFPNGATNLYPKLNNISNLYFAPSPLIVYQQLNLFTFNIGGTWSNNLTGMDFLSFKVNTYLQYGVNFSLFSGTLFLYPYNIQTAPANWATANSNCLNWSTNQINPTFNGTPVSYPFTPSAIKSYFIQDGQQGTTYGTIASPFYTTNAIWSAVGTTGTYTLMVFAPAGTTYGSISFSIEYINGLNSTGTGTWNMVANQTQTGDTLNVNKLI
jgi:hypothetical protein